MPPVPRLDSYRNSHHSSNHADVDDNDGLGDFGVPWNELGTSPKSFIGHIDTGINGGDDQDDMMYNKSNSSARSSTTGSSSHGTDRAKLQQHGFTWEKTKVVRMLSSRSLLSAATMEWEANDSDSDYSSDSSDDSSSDGDSADWDEDVELEPNHPFHINNSAGFFFDFEGAALSEDENDTEGLWDDGIGKQDQLENPDCNADGTNDDSDHDSMLASTLAQLSPQELAMELRKLHEGLAMNGNLSFVQGYQQQLQQQLHQQKYHNDASNTSPRKTTSNRRSSMKRTSTKSSHR